MQIILIILAVILVIIALIAFLFMRSSHSTEKRALAHESFLIAPVGPTTVIPSIPLSESVAPIEAEDPGVRAISSDGADPVALTFDAKVARYGLGHARDKRVLSAIASRTAAYWKPIFQEELERNDNLEWWDDISYPINDSGETVPREETDDQLDVYGSQSRIPPM